MTDTLPDVVVVGQRRSNPGNPFPERPEPATGPVDPNTPEIGDETPLDPCLNPDTALAWNADAAGARSAGAFLSKAAGVGDINPQTGMPTLANREFGRGLARGPNGSVWGNAVTPGPDRNPAPGSVSTVTVIMDPITFDDYIGDAHSHPNGNEYPSQQDWDAFILNNNQARARPGRANDTFYMYITVVNPDGTPGTTYVYEDKPRAIGSPNPPRPTTLGDEVNPDAEPCP